MKWGSMGKDEWEGLICKPGLLVSDRREVWAHVTLAFTSGLRKTRIHSQMEEKGMPMGR